MSDKKHIDRLFQEGFKDFEATPSDAVWENIEAQLNEKKKKRRVIPIWWRYAGVAALLLLLLTIGGVYFNNTGKTPNNQVVDIEKTTPSDLKKDNIINPDNAKDAAITNTDSNKNLDNTESQTKTAPSSNKIISSKESSIAETPASKNDNGNENASNVSTQKRQNTINKLLKTKSNNAVAENLEEKNNTDKILKKSKNNIASADNSEAKKDIEKFQNTLKRNTAIVSDSEKNNQVDQQNKGLLVDKEKTKVIINNASKNNNVIVAETKEENTETVVNNKVEKNTLTIEEAIDKSKDIAKEKENTNRWSIAPNAAPVYFNTLGKGSSLGSQLNSNPKSGDLNMSYGISASYAINKKLRVRSGINRVNLGYNTNNVVEFQSVGVNSSSRALQNVNAIQTNNNSPESDNISIVTGQGFLTNDLPDSFSSSSTSTYNQDLGYIEVPLEIQYALLDKKFGVNLIGGFSSFFLNNHKLVSESEDGERTLFGVANNINKISYSANIGLGLNYQISKKIDLNLEPMFKYQINTFNNTTGDFKPFFIGVYTGFAIKF